MTSTPRQSAILPWAAPLLAVGLFCIAFALVDARQRGLLANTLTIVLSVEAIVLPWAVVFAFAWRRRSFPGRDWVGPAVVCAMFLPLYLHDAGWEAGFGRLGWQTLWFRATQQPLLSGWQAVVFVHAMHAWAWATLFIASALDQVDPELEDAARLVGGPWFVFRQIVAPRCLETVAVAAVWVALLVAGEMTISNIYIVRTFAEEIYTNFSIERSVWIASAAVLPGTLCLVALACVGLSIAPSLARSTGSRPAAQRRTSFPSRADSLAAFVVWGSLAWVLGVPLFNLVYKAGLTADLAIGARWSLDKLVRTLGNCAWRFGPEFSATLQLALTVAVVATIVGTLLAWWLRLRPRWRMPVAVAMVLALAMPSPVVGVLVIRALNQPAILGLTWLYDETLAAPTLAICFRAIPLATLIVGRAMASIPQERLDLARLEGLGTWQLLGQVAIPGRISALVAAFVASAAVAAGDLSCSILTLPPAFETVAFRMFGFIHVGAEEQVCGLGLLNLAMFAIAAVFAKRWFA